MDTDSGLIGQNQNLKRFTIVNFVVIVAIFLFVSLLSQRRYDGRISDFAVYWLAGHMVAAGQYVYDTDAWLAERDSQGIAIHAEPTFQYPLPFAVIFVPLGLLPVQQANTIWLFFSQLAILISIAILLNFYPTRTAYTDLLIVGGLFLFRPVFMTLEKGQSLPLFLLSICCAIFLLDRKKWFSGGLLLSFLALKPSLGVPVLALIGLWLLARKQWLGLLGMAAGGVASVLIGMMLNSQWLVDYVSIGGDSFSKYYGMHPTFWGAADKILVANDRSIPVAVSIVLIVFAIQAWLFWKGKVEDNVLEAFSIILPAGLLVAPYSWAYDQILLIIPIVYIMSRISLSSGSSLSLLFLIGTVGCAIALVLISHQVLHDVWSFLNSFLIWMLALYFATRDPLYKIKA
ncbi:MAG TPA: glycosyltransferase family 87 protein [Anaerolineales bacterium]|nr:glycosyltransferase family 87 protein [Anaerolineales bacterium]